MRVKVKRTIQGDITGFIIEPGEIGIIVMQIGYDLYLKFQGSMSIFRIRRDSPLVEVIE